MKKTRKLIALILSITMVFGTIVIPGSVYAAEPKAKLHLDYLGLNTEAMKATGIAGLLAAPKSPQPIEELKEGDIFWVGYRVSDASDVQYFKNGLQGMTYGIDYDSDYIEVAGLEMLTAEDKTFYAKAPYRFKFTAGENGIFQALVLKYNTCMTPNAETGDSTNIMWGDSYTTYDGMTATNIKPHESKVESILDGSNNKVALFETTAGSADLEYLRKIETDGDEYLFRIPFIVKAPVPAGTKVIQAALSGETFVIGSGLSGATTLVWNETSDLDQPTNLKNILAFQGNPNLAPFKYEITADKNNADSTVGANKTFANVLEDGSLASMDAKETAKPDATEETKALYDLPTDYDATTKYHTGKWFTDAACSDGKEFTADTIITADMVTDGKLTIYAQWADKAKITINYDDRDINGSAALKEVTTYAKPNTVEVPSALEVNEPKSMDPTNYKFNDFYIDEAYTNKTGITVKSGTAGEQNRVYEITYPGAGENLDIYAKWDKPVDVELVSKGDVANTTIVKKFPGEKMTFAQGTDADDILKDAKKLKEANKYFKGWYASATDSTGASLIEETITEAITYYGYFTSSPTLTFNFNDGGITPNRVVYEEEQDIAQAIDIPTPSSRPGYKFTKWTVDGVDLTTLIKEGKYSFNKLSKEAIAQWEVDGEVPPAQQVTITFHNNDAISGTPETTTSRTIKANDEIGSLPTPIRTNYDLVGWYTKAIGGEAINSKTIVTKNTDYYAQWKVNEKVEETEKVTITFTGVETAIAPIEIVKGGILGALTPENPIKTGSGFTGWNIVEEGTSLINKTALAAKVIATNITVNANWAANTYQVIFDANSGIFAAGADISGDGKTRTITAGITAIDLSVVPTRANYTFDKWNMASDGSGKGAFLEVEGKGVQFPGGIVDRDATVYATWTPVETLKKTVIFNNNDGTNITNKYDIVLGDSFGVFMPVEPTRTDYTFAGWNTKANGSGEAFKNDTKVNANLTVYAQWVAVEGAVEIIFDATDATTASNPLKKTIAKGTTIGMLNMPSEPLKSGYTFKNWRTGANGTGSIFDGNTVVSANIRVFPEWSDASENLVTLTFDSQGAQTEANPNSKTVKMGEMVNILPIAPVKDNYSFGGWFTEVNGAGTKVTGTFVINANQTVYAYWIVNVPEAQQVTVKFNVNGGDISSKPADIVLKANDTLVKLPADPTRIGYVFTGWNSSADGMGTDYLASTPITKNIELFAKWQTKAAEDTVTVIFNENGGDTVANPGTKSTKKGSALPSLPAEPSKTNYDFAGWKDVDGAVFTADTKVNADMTVYAQWEVKATAAKATIIFKTDENTTHATIEIAKNTALKEKMPANPVQTGFAFENWIYDTNKILTAETIIAENLTVMAAWTADQYTVTFDAGGGTPRLQTVNTTQTTGDKTVVLPIAPTRDGYIFHSWNTAIDTNGVATGTIFDATTPVVAPIKVYAVWTKVTPEIKTWEVSFDKNTGITEASPNTILVVQGADGAAAPITSLPTTNPTKTGYTFNGWGTTPSSKTADFTVGHSISGNTVVYAIWKVIEAPTVPKFTVTFDLNGGNGSIVTIEVPENTSLDSNMPANPIHDTLSFNGWTIGDTNEVFTKDTKVTKNITVKAQWASVVSEYTVTFNGNGGTPATATAKGSVAGTILPTEPTRTGYIFKGWNTKADGSGSPFVATTPVTAATTVYAKWAEDIKPVESVTITFKLNDGSDNNHKVQTINKGDTLTTLPNNPTRATYGFVEWNTQADGAGAKFDGLTAITENTTVYAKWSTTVFNVTFDGNGGTMNNGTTDVTTWTKATIGETKKVELPDETKMKRAGYTFVGWSTVKNGTENFTAETILSQDTTVYAVWSIAAAGSHEITFNFNYTGAPEAIKLSVAKGQSFGEAMIADPVRENYIFGGWTLSAIGGTAFTSASIPNNPMTVYAQWTPDMSKVETVTVTFSAAEATTGPTPTSRAYVVTVTGENKEYPVFPAGGFPMVTREGFTVKGWVDANGTPFEVGNTISANITVYAQWKVDDTSTVTVTFDKNTGDKDAKPNVMSVEKGKSVGTLPGVPTKDKYEFKGWATTSNATASNFISTTPVNGDIRVYAIWTVDPLATKHTVTLDLNGGTLEGKLTREVVDGTSLGSNMPANPTRRGYAFVKWHKGNITGDEFTKDTIVTEATTVVAEWIANEYNITFDANQGIGTTSVVTTNKQVVELPTPPTRIDYEFAGWNTKIDTIGGKVFDETNVVGGGNPITFEANTTLYAQWRKLDKETLVKVIFNGNGADKDGTKTMAQGKLVEGKVTIALPTAEEEPTKVGHTFDKWTIGKDASTTPFTGVDVTSDMTVYAQWTVDPLATTYTVTFDPAGGTLEGTATRTIAENKALGETMPVNPIHATKGFRGWGTSSTGEKVNFNAITPVNANMTVYAKWSAEEQVTVTFDGNGGELSKTSLTLAPNATVGANMPTGTRADYTLTGWNEANDGSGKAFTNNTVVSANIKVYAQWSKTISSAWYVSFDVNGGVTPIATIPVTKNSQIAAIAGAMPANPTYTDGAKIFQGWKVIDNGGSTTIKVGTIYRPDKDTNEVIGLKTLTIDANISLQAVWVKYLEAAFTIGDNQRAGQKIDATVVFTDTTTTKLRAAGDVITPTDYKIYYDADKNNIYTTGEENWPTNIVPASYSLSLDMTDERYFVIAKTITAGAGTVEGDNIVVKVDASPVDYVITVPSDAKGNGTTKADKYPSFGTYTINDVGLTLTSSDVDAKYRLWTDENGNKKVDAGELGPQTAENVTVEIGKYIVVPEFANKALYIAGVPTSIIKAEGGSAEDKNAIEQVTVPAMDGNPEYQAVTFVIAPSEKTLTFNYGDKSNNETSVVKMVVAFGDTIENSGKTEGGDDQTTLPATPVSKVGQEFAYWVIDVNNDKVYDAADTVKFTEKTVVTDNLSLLPLWVAKIELAYGNSPYGEISKMNGVGPWDNTGTWNTAKVEAAKEAFDVANKYGTGYVPTDCDASIKYTKNAWGTGTELKAYDETGKRNVASAGEYINYDKDETAVIAYMRTTFADPGMKVYNSKGELVALHATNPESQVTRKITVDKMASSGIANFTNGVTSHEVASQVLNGTSGENMISGLKDTLTKTGIYKIEYTYNDSLAVGGKITAERTLIVLQIIGDVDLSGIVNIGDISTLNTRNIEGKELPSKTTPGSEVQGRLYEFRVADIDKSDIINIGDISTLNTRNIEGKELKEFYRTLTK